MDESMARYDFETLPVAALVVDEQGTVIAANAAARQLGWPLDRLMTGAARQAAWAGLVEAGQGAFEIEVDTPGGPRRVRVSGVVRDRVALVCLTELGDATAWHESLGLIAGGVAHELNNQLVGVVSEASLLREDAALDEDQREAIARIDAAARRMTQLARQLLAYSGRGRLVPRLIDPDALVADSGPRLARMMPASVTFELAPGGVPAAVEADRSLLRHVIVDLVENAAEAATSTVRVSSRIADGAWELVVEDDGAGMDATTRARIFEPFFTTRSGHSGLGLPAVLGTIHRLGGEVAVTSEPRRGATFIVRLPLVPGVVVPRWESKAEPPVGERLAGLRILVADDEPLVRQAIRRALVRRRAVPVLASDGGEAEQLLRTERFDVVLVDVLMPEKTGYQLVPIVRVTQPDTPVILMSGFSEQRPEAEQPDAFLEKPFDVSSLETAIRAAMAREWSPDGDD